MQTPGTQQYNVVDIRSCLQNDKNIEQYIDVLGQLSSGSCPERNIDAVKNFIENEDNIYIFVVKFNDMVVGGGTLMIENKIIHNMGKVGHIEDIVIRKDFRGKKLSTKLLNKLISVAEDKQCYKCILTASDEVCGVYKKVGFYSSGMNMRLNIND